MPPTDNLKQESQDLAAVWHKLVEWFRPHAHVAVAFSGGVDSGLVLRAAFEAKGKSKVIAITADSASLARRELESCQGLAAQLGVNHKILATQELQNEDYAKNDGSRCFHCKTELYRSLGTWLRSLERASLFPGTENIRPVIVDGLNADDLGDDRPGRAAADSAGVLHPLVEQGIGKPLVRELARFIGLSIWDKPAMACLSSRIARGVAVNADRLSMVEGAEEILRREGYSGMRVRFHLLAGSPEQRLARIEFQHDDLRGFLAAEHRHDILAELRQLGFHHVTIDAEGYKRGGVS